MAVPIATAMKAALYLTLREQGRNRSELTQRLGEDEHEARCIMNDVDRGQLPALEAALHCLGKRPELRIA